jgi:hypothetical protein
MEILDMKIATTQSERLALIKEIAQRKKLMSKIKSESNLVIGKAKASSKPARTFMDVPEDASKNPNYYTDSSKYAAQYYGETFHETTKFDSHFANGDWD